MIRPAQFSEEGWNELLPFLERQSEGGITIIAVEVLETQNFPRVSFGTFGPDAKKRLRRALAGEKRREGKPLPLLRKKNALAGLLGHPCKESLAR